MSHLNAIVRRVILEAETKGSEPEDPSFWREVGKTVKRAAIAAPSTLESWAKSAPDVAAFILSPTGLRAAVAKGFIDTLSAPANAPGPNDRIYTREAWALQQFHTILQAAGAGMDAADIVDGLLYFAEALTEQDDRKKEGLLNNGAISMVASIPAFGTALAARRVLNGAQITDAHIRQIGDVLDVPEAVNLLGRQGVEDAQQAVQALRAQETITKVADPARERYADRIVDVVKREAFENLDRHMRGEITLSNVSREDPRYAVAARDAAIHAKTGDYTVPRLPDPSDDSRRAFEDSSAQLRSRGGTAEHATAARGAMEALSRMGFRTLGVNFMNSSGRLGTVIIGPSGKRYAYYVSSGTGGATPVGTWVPYEGQSLGFLRDGEIHHWVIKHGSDSSSKVPRSAGGGEARDAFDAANHPDVREALKRLPVADGFDAGNVDNWNAEPLGNLAYRIEQIGLENAWLHRNGVALNESGSVTASSQYLLPWPHDVPVPGYLAGKVVTSNDVMQGLRWTEIDPRTRTPVSLTYGQWMTTPNSQTLQAASYGNPVLSGVEINRSGYGPVIRNFGGR